MIFPPTPTEQILELQSIPDPPFTVTTFFSLVREFGQGIAVVAVEKHRKLPFQEIAVGIPFTGKSLKYLPLKDSLPLQWVYYCMGLTRMPDRLEEEPPALSSYSLYDLSPRMGSHGSTNSYYSRISLDPSLDNELIVVPLLISSTSSQDLKGLFNSAYFLHGCEHIQEDGKSMMMRPLMNNQKFVVGTRNANHYSPHYRFEVFPEILPTLNDNPVTRIMFANPCYVELYRSKGANNTSITVVEPLKKFNETPFNVEIQLGVKPFSEAIYGNMFF